MDFQDRFSNFSRQLDALYLNWRRQETLSASALFHYTTAEGLIGITTSGKLWASNAGFLNDASEPGYADSIIRSSIESVKNQLGVGSEAKVREVFDSFGEWAAPLMSSNAAPDVYVFSMSEEGDLLSQWRAYTNQGSGYVVGFSSGRLIDLARRLPEGRYLMRVEYERDSQMVIASETLRTIANVFGEYVASAGTMSEEEEEWFQGRLRNAIISEIPRLRSIFKTPAYREEREWRIVQFVPRDSSQYAIVFRSNRGRLVPYLELAFGKAEPLPITEVTVGPTLDPGPSSRTVELLLKKRGYENVNVRVSNVPFRL